MRMLNFVLNVLALSVVHTLAGNLGEAGATQQQPGNLSGVTLFQFDAERLFKHSSSRTPDPDDGEGVDLHKSLVTDEGDSSLKSRIAEDFVDDQGLRHVVWSRKQLEQTNVDGCRYIFLDLGANVGVHVRELFEAHKYPKSPYLKLFDRYLHPSPPDFSGICAFGFEANPDHAHRLNLIEQEYRQLGWRVQMFAPFAISDTDGTVDIFGEKPSKNSWGTSVVDRKREQPGHGVVTHTVPKFDFNAWVRKYIVNRRPEVKFVLAKMDIEASEYLVLPAMARSGDRTLCRERGIDFMTVEWHKFHKEGARSREKIIKDVNRLQCPSTELANLDDEEYLFDNKPLPGSASGSRRERLDQEVRLSDAS